MRTITVVVLLAIFCFVEAFPFTQRLRRQSGATQGSDLLDISDSRCNSEELQQIMTEVCSFNNSLLPSSQNNLANQR